MGTLTNIFTEGLFILLMICFFSSSGQVPSEAFEDPYDNDPSGPLWLHVIIFIAVVVGVLCSLSFDHFMDYRDTKKK